MKYIKQTVHVMTVFLLTAMPVLAHAQARLENPLNFNSINDFIAGALQILVMVALPFVTLFIVYAGFLFVTAQGNEEKLSKAKWNFFYVIIGSLLLLGAWALATLIGGTVEQLRA